MTAHRYPQGPSSRPQRTNTLAKVAFLCGLVFFLAPFTGFAAIILGHKARRQIRQTGEDGRRLATAGLILGYIFTSLWVILAFPLEVAQLFHGLFSL
jgi:hypothetical protein